MVCNGTVEVVFTVVEDAEPLVGVGIAAGGGVEPPLPGTTAPGVSPNTVDLGSIGLLLGSTIAMKF